MDKKANQELNLIQVFSLLANWIKKTTFALFRAIGYSIQQSIKYWYVFALTFLLFLSAALYLSRSSSQKYIAETVLHSGLYNIDLVNELIDQFRANVAGDNPYNYVNKFNLPDSVKHSLLKIERFDIIDYLDDSTPNKIDFNHSHNQSDSLNLVMDDRVFLRMKIKNINHIDTIYSALMSYLNNNPRLISEFESNKKFYTDFVGILDKELYRVDSLAEKSYFLKEEVMEMRLEYQTFLVGERKKPLFINDFVEIAKQRKKYSKILENASAPVYSTTGIIVKGPINNRLKYGLYGVIWGGIAGLLASSIYSKRKKIFDYLLDRN